MGRAGEVVLPKLSSLSSAQLIKIIVAIGKVAACRSLLEASALEALTRFETLPHPQLVLLTQSLLGLGERHIVMTKLLESWHRLCSSKDPPAADHLAKLMQLVVPVAPSHAVCETIARELADDPSALSGTARASLETSLTNELSHVEFKGKSALQRSLSRTAQGVSAKRSRSRGRQRQRTRSRSHDRTRRRSRRR